MTNKLIIGAAAIAFFQFLIILVYASRQKRAASRLHAMESALKKSDNHVRLLQSGMRDTRMKEQDMTRIFLFLPELISKLTSYNEKRDIFNIVIEWIDRLLEPDRAYIFIEKDGVWVSAIKKDPQNPEDKLVCGRSEGILSVVAELKMTIDQDDYSLLSVEKQSLVSHDPLAHLGLQVCAPLVYNNDVYGIIALGGIPGYSKQKKTLVNMLSDLAANSLVNSILFGRFRHMANRDPLTDLMNKRAFEKAILDTILDASKKKKFFSVFLFDIDFFKRYNDTNGHQAGDEALRITGKLIKENFRSGDVKARYGGEEFIVLMKDTPKDQAYALAEKFRQIVESHPYPLEQKSQPGGKVTVSGGVATFPGDGSNIKEVIEMADEALYSAKEKGRNRIVMARAADFAESLGPEINA
jgi:diguanylate cyclase (GGDEF)-like protein